jgi:drug/metabolite transporter (DMT)-like permease
MFIRPQSALHRHAISGVLMLIVTTVFGGYSILAHKALSGSSTLHPLVFALVRDSIGTLLLFFGLYFEARAAAAKAVGAGEGGSSLPLVAATGDGAGAAPFLPVRSDIPQLMLCGFCGVWCSQAGSAMALKNLDAVTMAIMQPLLPAVTAIGSIAAGYEVWKRGAPSTWLKVAGLATSIAGACFVAYVSSSGSASSANNVALGLLFVGIQVTGGGLYSIAQKPLLLAGHSPLFVATWGYAMGWCILVLCTVSGCTEAQNWAWTPSSAGAAVYSGVLSSAFCYYAMCVCVDLAGPLFMAAFFPFMPVATVVLNWVSGGGLPGLQEALGGLVVASGLALFVFGKAREEAEKRSAEGGLLLEEEGGVALLDKHQEGGAERQ